MAKGTFLFLVVDRVIQAILQTGTFAQVATDGRHTGANRYGRLSGPREDGPQVAIGGKIESGVLGS